MSQLYGKRRVIFHMACYWNWVQTTYLNIEFNVQFAQCNFSQGMKCLLVKEGTHFTTLEGNIEYIFDIFDNLLYAVYFFFTDVRMKHYSIYTREMKYYVLNHSFLRVSQQPL